MSQCQPGTERLDDIMKNLERVSGLTGLYGEEGMLTGLTPVVNNTEPLQQRALAAWA